MSCVSRFCMGCFEAAAHVGGCVGICAHRELHECHTHHTVLSLLARLEKQSYKTVDEFVLDLRRIASNCLQYNTTVNDSFRPVATDFLSAAEDLCKFFIAKPESPKSVYPPLLYCWSGCVNALDQLLNMTNPDDGHQTAWYFLQPVNFFCGGQWPEGYLEKVKKPIDLGTIVQQLITGNYPSVAAFVENCRGVVENCRAFYHGDAEGKVFVDRANRLNESMETTLGDLVLFDQSPEGTKAREKFASKYTTIKKPDKEFLKDIMRELRAATYTDKGTRITEKATLHFEKPVDTDMFADYLQFVETPMDLETVDRKIDSGSCECAFRIIDCIKWTLSNARVVMPPYTVFLAPRCNTGRL